MEQTPCFNIFKLSLKMGEERNFPFLFANFHSQKGEAQPTRQGSRREKLRSRKTQGGDQVQADFPRKPQKNCNFSLLV